MGKMTMESLLSRVGLMLPRKHSSTSSSSTVTTAYASNAKIGVLTFEVASLMAKTVRLHQSLTDDKISLLKNTIAHQDGVRKLVSDDEEFLLGLALSEVLDLFSFLSRSTARLGRKCSDPVLRRFEDALSDLVVFSKDQFRLEYVGRKKLERKMKKMERFISASVGLYQEIEVLSELELGLKRLQQQHHQRGGDQGNGSLSAFKQKVVWQRQEVRNLKEASLWNRSYDYTVKLLARSLFSIFGRVKQVFLLQNDGNCSGVGVENGNDSRILDWLELHRSHSSIINGPVKSTLHRRTVSMSGPLRMYGPISEDLGMSKSGPVPRMNYVVSRGRERRQQRWPPLFQSIIRSGFKTRRLTPGGPFKGCIAVGDDSQVLQSCVPSDSEVRRSAAMSRILDVDGCDSLNAQFVGSNLKKALCLSLFEPQHKLLMPIPSTLADSALALHYANVIVVIEKLATSPHLIGPDARDDLYNMLPNSIRSELRARLKMYAKNLATSVYDPVLATEWSDAVARILEWLAPLAHNMIRWHSEHNYEQQHLFAKTSVLLLQTLYFANQAKTEAAITELLVGLNYLWRFGRELHAKATMESMSSENCHEHLDAKGS